LLHTGWQSSAEKFGFDVNDPPPDPVAFISDGDIVEVAGLRLRAITTPGHTPGSVSYYADEGLLFSGDTLFRGSIGRTDFPGGNLDQEMTSICDKLLTLPDDTTVLPGHMQQTTIGFERENNPFVADWLRKQAD
jgi:glyoxylase-like metal-dependent hydrolase (beta-lactamase superfamily II)